MKHWQIIADRLSNHWLDLGLRVSRGFWGRTIWIADAHRGDGKRFVVRTDEKLTVFLGLESVTRRLPPFYRGRKLDDFSFEFGLGFAFRDERLDSFVDDIGDPHLSSLRYLAKPPHHWLVEPIERPAT